MPISKELLKSIKNNKFTEEELTLVDEELNDEDIFLLVDALKHNTHVKRLDLGVNNISDNGAKSLATLMTLESLNISSNNIGPEGINALARSNLKKLDISANPIGDAVGVLSSSQKLEELVASQCEITDIGAQQLFLSTSIKRLDLSTNELHGSCLKDIGQNRVLEDLDLMQTRLSEESCNYFYSNTALRRLNLTNVLIGDIGASLLAKSTTLRELILMQCSIGDPGAIALSQNNSIRRLVLPSNRIQEAGLEALARNNHFFYLSLNGNPFHSVPIIFRQRYAEGSGDVFKRDEVFIAELLKRDFEEKHPSMTREALGSGSTFANFTPQRSNGLQTEKKATRSPPKAVAIAVVSDPNYSSFFDNFDANELKDFFSVVEQTIDGRKKRKVSPRPLKPGGFF